MAMAVEARRLRKQYEDHQALAGVDLTVEAGTVLGVLGPNGAGKTTTVDILTTRTLPDGGTARVFGADVVRNRDAVRRQIAVARQDSSVDLFLTGRENLATCARLLGATKREARMRADQLLERFDLGRAADDMASAYSGGMRRRLDLAICLVGEPRLLFLDEPTTGLDPTSRAELWAVVRGLVAAGTTVVLTTQYLEEADALADRIVFIDSGSVVAEGTPAQLKRLIAGRDRLQITVARPDQVATTHQLLHELGLPATRSDLDRCQVTAGIDDGLEGMLEVGMRLRENGVQVVDFGLRRPSLDEVFAAVTSTGHTRDAVGAR